MFVQDSRRSYRTYRYSELILKTDLCLFRTPVGVTELIVIQNLYLKQTYVYSGLSLELQNLFLKYGVYTCSEIPVGITEITERMLVLQNLFMAYGSYTGITEHVLVLRILYGAYSGTELPVGTTQIHYTKVHVGTTGFILIVRIRDYS